MTTYFLECGILLLIFTLLLQKYKQIMEIINKELKEPRKRKSELLSREEHTYLKKLVASFPTVVDAAEAIGVNRQTLDRVLIIGKASPENIQIIRQKLNRAA